MKATTIGLSAAALLVSGCIVREVREIHHVRDNGTRAPGDTGDSSAPCEGDGCDSGAAPGAMMADSQPPPPLVEEALDQPGDGYVWTDGYWHWNGSEWVWISGTWYPPVEAGVVFIPPAYYTAGSSCLYVPGRWQHDGRVVSVRDYRTRRPSHSDEPTKRAPVRDYRTSRGAKDRGRQPVRDYRGEKPVTPPDVDRAVDRDSDIVIRVPARRFRGQPAGAPDRSPGRGDADAVRVDRDRLRAVDGDRDGRDASDDRVIDAGGGRGIDVRGDRDIDAGGGPVNDVGGDRPGREMPDYVIVRPRPDRIRPDRRPTGPDVSGPGSPPSPTRGSPTMRGQWVRPMSPPSRGAPPVMVPPSRAPSSPSRTNQPVRVMSPRPVSPPPRTGQPAAGQPRAPASPPASSPAKSGSRGRQAPAPRGSRR